MAKVKAPLLSLRATQTVGKTLTFSQWRRLNVAKTIPTHPDARTPAQLAHRLNYSHARDFWLTLTPDEKAVLLTQGRPARVTGYNLSLQRYLLDLLYLDAWFPLNDGVSATAEDYSMHRTDGAIQGPIPAVDFCGQVNNALWFDDLNDRVQATTPQLDYTSANFSLVVRAYFDDLSSTDGLICRGLDNTDGYRFYVSATGRIVFRTSQAAAQQNSITAPGVVVPGQWYTLSISRIGAAVSVYLDGVLQAVGPPAHIDPAPCARTLKIGVYDDLFSTPMGGTICDVKFYSRILLPAEHLAHHQRYCVHPRRLGG